MSDHEDDIYGPRLGPWKGTGELVREDEQPTVARAAAIVDLIDAGPGDGRIEIHSGSQPKHAGEPVREGDPAHVAACDYVPVLITADYLRQLKREDRRAARKRRRQARRAKAQVGHTCYLGGGIREQHAACVDCPVCRARAKGGQA